MWFWLCHARGLASIDRSNSAPYPTHPGRKAQDVQIVCAIIIGAIAGVTARWISLSPQSSRDSCGGLGWGSSAASSRPFWVARSISTARPACGLSRASGQTLKLGSTVCGGNLSGAKLVTTQLDIANGHPWPAQSQSYIFFARTPTIVVGSLNDSGMPVAVQPFDKRFFPNPREVPHERFPRCRSRDCRPGPGKGG